MEKKSIFITGANGGLGFETAKQLVKNGAKRIVLAARTDQKATAAKTRLEKEPNLKSKLEAVGGFDMTNPQSIENAITALPKDQPFDVIFLQAGGVVFKDDYQYVSYAGKQIEKTVFQNAIGGYITLASLMKNNLVAPNARIVFAGGEGARGIPRLIEKPVFKDGNDFENYLLGNGTLKKYKPMNAIGVSKFASTLMVQKLAELNDGREYIWFTPGLTHGTKGLAAQSAIKRFFAEKIAFGITGLLGLSQSPEKGASKYVAALLGKYGKNGDVLGAPEGKALGKIVDQKPMNTSMTDPSIINGFWNMLQEIYPLPVGVEA